MAWDLDPELAPLAEFIPSTSLDDIPAAWAQLVKLIADFAPDPDLSALDVTDHQVPGADGAPDVLVRVYRPLADPGERGFAALLYLHGGGFVLGSVESEHVGAAQLATQMGIVVASVDYRLAPEDPFPAGLDDCYQALCWLHEQADTFGVDRARIGVMGQSAGGGLAAATALVARDRGGPALCFQLLGIPELDDRLETPSMQAFVDTPLWNRPAAEWSWRYYLGENPGEVSPYAAPARATDLSGLPPAYVSTMEFDPLRDEGMIYAMRMLQAGVSVELHQYPGTFHGSQVVVTAAISRRIASEQADVIRRHLGLVAPV